MKELKKRYIVPNTYHLKTYRLLVISSRESRYHQKKYLELDETEQVIVQCAKNKAYSITPITANNEYFSNPGVIKHLRESMTQGDWKEYAYTIKSDEDIKILLGL